MRAWWGGRVPQTLGQVKVGRDSAAGWEGGGHMRALGLEGMHIRCLGSWGAYQAFGGMGWRSV